MAEGTSLLRMHTAYTRIVGSNPTVSAKIDEKSHRKVAFFIPEDQYGVCAPIGYSGTLSRASNP